AAILVGNANLGEHYQGMTTTQLDSYNVYATDCSGLSVAASVVGFEKAIAMLDRVIVASIQSDSGPAGAIATAASQAVDAGAVVVAPWGYRTGGNEAVSSPANAHKTLNASGVTLKPQIQAATTDERAQPALYLPVTLQTS